MSEQFPGRLGIQQRVLPSYRAAFMETLAASCRDGLGVYAGQPLPNEGIDPVDHLQVAQYIHAKNRCFSHPGSPFFICWQAGLMNWLETFQPDALILEANPRYPVSRKAIHWMHARRRKVIGWGLGAPPLAGPMAGFRRWERMKFLGSLDAVIAYSRQGAEQYQQLGMPSERVYVASNAVDLAPKIPPPLKAIQFDGQANVLFVGRLQARKRLDLLFQACAALPHNLQPHLTIVGDGPVREDLENLSHKIYPNVEFSGAKHGAELEPYFIKADLFVLPGTGGLAIQQAMAHGLPVVVARGDGTQDDLVRSENGWQIPPDDLTALTAALRLALSDSAKLRLMGAASYRIVAAEVNVTHMAMVFIQALKEVTNSVSLTPDT